MKTHEIAQMLNIPKQTLLYYEREGFIHPKRDTNGYRCFSRIEIDTLRYIQIMRSMDISIQDMKSIFNNQTTIKNVLQNKKDYIEQRKLELDDIDNKIKNFIKRKRVVIQIDDLNHSSQYDILYFNQDNICYLDEKISIDKVLSVDISMCSSQGRDGLYFMLLNYYIDLDIVVQNNIYSFQILNNKQVSRMFDYFLKHNLTINDPLDLNKIYHKITDPVKLNKYFNSHFREWAKKYELDNPRDNYFSAVNDGMIKPSNEIKQQKLLIRDQFIELYNVWKLWVIKQLKRINKRSS